MRRGLQVSDGAIGVEIADAGSFPVVTVKGDLQFPCMVTGRRFELILRILPDGEFALLYGHGLEDIKTIDIVNLHNESRQSAELPRPATNGNIGREPGDVVTTAPAAGGFLAWMAEDGLRLVG